MERQISFDCTREDATIINRIVDRAEEMAWELNIHFDRKNMAMDITSCHCNGCPLRLADLESAPDWDFGHDFFGISRYIDRKTGKIPVDFLPRLAKGNS